LGNPHLRKTEEAKTAEAEENAEGIHWELKIRGIRKVKKPLDNYAQCSRLGRGFFKVIKGRNKKSQTRHGKCRQKGSEVKKE